MLATNPARKWRGIFGTKVPKCSQAMLELLHGRTHSLLRYCSLGALELGPQHHLGW
jgi:hypothetical protein